MKQKFEQELRDYQDVAVLAFSEAKDATSLEHYEDAMAEWKEACARIKQLEFILKNLS